MSIEEINWEDVQLFYNNNKTWRDIKYNFNISYKLIEKSSLSCKLKPRKHSEETKKKISEIRKKYLQENPDKVPYKLNHSSKESYPEKYFTSVFKNEEIDVVKSFYIGIYELDFSIPDKKIDIEIDGSQHYYDEKIIESDKRRNKFLEDDGWDIIRVNWSEYQKLSFLEKREYILNLKNYINGLVNTKPTIKIIDNNIKNCLCGNNITKKSKQCLSCYSIKQRKVERPSIEILKKEVADLGYTAVGRKYGVSDNSIRKWIKYYERN
jgi:very-short-patch-repair endonuclease